MVARTALRTFVLNANGNRNVPYLNQNGERWYLNWNWLDNDFNRNGRVASNWQQMKTTGDVRRNGLSRHFPKPSAEHSAYFIQLFRECNIFFIVERLDFPDYLEKEFNHVQFRGSFFEIRKFTLSTEIACGEYRFNRFYKRSVDLSS